MRTRKKNSDVPDQRWLAWMRRHSDAFGRGGCFPYSAWIELMESRGLTPDEANYGLEAMIDLSPRLYWPEHPWWIIDYMRRAKRRRRDSWRRLWGRPCSAN